MADVNIEKIVIGFLDANKVTGWEVHGDMPNPRPDAFILVDRSGGPREYIVQDRAEILIEVYHKDSRERASDEANRISDILINLQVLEPVMKAKINSIVKLDDLIGEYWRYQIYCDVYYRRDISNDDIVYPTTPTTSSVESVNGKIGVVVLDTDDILDTPENRYTNDSDIERLSDTTGVNTGDQDLSGYATTNELTTGLAGKANTVHTHTASQVTDLNTAIATNSAVAANTAKVSFDSASSTKLAGIEAGADVTDSVNVNAAGAAMNTDTSTSAMDFVVDEDNMVSNSATKVPTQQSVKAYVDANVGGAVDSVNGQTGGVVLNASDVGAVNKTGDAIEGTFTNSAPLTQVLLNGSNTGNNSVGQPITNTSPRLELGTHQYSEYRALEAQKGGYSEVIRLVNLDPLAKATMAWYDHDYNPTAWIVSHFQPQDLRSYANLASFPATGVNDGLRAYYAEDSELYYTWNGSTYIPLLPTNSQYYFRAIHQHISTETSDSTRTALYTRLAIPYGLDIVPITTSNAHLRITGGTNNGVESGAFIVDNGKMFSINPIILYPNSANAGTVETWKDDPTDNIFANNTEGLRIRVLASGNADNLVSGQRMVSLNAEGVNFMGIAENLILGGATAVSMGINRSAGVTLDVRRDLGLTSATHVISRLSRSDSDGFMNFGYIADGTTLQSFVINPTSNKNFVIALTGLPNALFIANTTGRIGIGKNNPTTALDVVGGGAFTAKVTVPDEAYDATAWNGSLEVPTKNAIRDKIDTMDTAIAFNTAKISFDALSSSKLNGIEAGAEVNNISDANATDLTDAGDSTLHFHSADRNRANHTGTQTASTISDFATAVAATASVTANTAKVTNQTHTGDVTGATALTIANDAVTNGKAANMAQNTIKGRIASGTGDPEDLTAANIRTITETETTSQLNTRDTNNRARANHTGTQLASTISDFTGAVVATTVVVRVIHGSTAGTARPSGATYVEWVGNVEPTNATNNDTWIQT